MKQTSKNTYTFDHLEMRGWAGNVDIVDESQPARLGVLEVGDGEFFQVIVRNTYAPCFSYFVTANDEARPESASQVPGEPREVPRDALKPVVVTMKHHRAFQKYRVSITAKCASGATVVPKPTGEAAPPFGPPAAPKTVELREIAFDLWVWTAPTWKLMINGGVGFHAFDNPQYFVATEKTTDANGAVTETKLFKEGEPERKARPAIMTLITAFPPTRGWLRHVGPSIGFGGQNGDLRYYFGGSLSLGDHFLLTAGRARGFVNAPPTGQELDKPPISDNVLGNLRSVPTSAWYFGFALGFDVKSTSDAVTAFSASATGSGSGEKPPALSQFTGTYASDAEVITVSTDGVGILVRTNSSNFAFPVQKGKAFHEAAGGQSAEFEVPADSKTATAVTLKLSGGESKASRAAALNVFAGTYVTSGDTPVTYVVAVSGTGLTVKIGNAEPELYNRRGNAKFVDNKTGNELTFTVEKDKATSLELAKVTATRKQ